MYQSSHGKINNESFTCVAATMSSLDGFSLKTSLSASALFTRNTEISTSTSIQVKFSSTQTATFVHVYL